MCRVEPRYLVLRHRRPHAAARTDPAAPRLACEWNRLVVDDLRDETEVVRRPDRAIRDLPRSTPVQRGLNRSTTSSVALAMRSSLGNQQKCDVTNRPPRFRSRFASVIAGAVPK